MAITKNVIIGKPICKPWHMFCNTEDEWEDEKKNTIFTQERFLPKILVECGVVKSISEVRRNKKELVTELNKPDFLEVKWGKNRIFIQVGE